MKLIDTQTEFVSIAYLLTRVKSEREICFDIADKMGVTEETYTQPDCKSLFTAMLAFRDVEDGPDFHAISHKSGVSVESIRDISSTKDRRGYFSYHTEILRGLEKRRNIVSAGLSIAEIGGDSNYDAEFCFSMAEAELQKASKKSKQVNGGGMVSEIADQRIRQYETNYRDGVGGLATGVSWLDDILGNLQPGRVYLVSGGPKAGKTTAIRKIAVSVARRGIRVSFASLELLPDEIFDWMVCSEAQIPLQELQKANEIRHLETFKTFATAMKDYPMSLAGGPMTPSYFQAWAKREVVKGSQLILLDYMQALQPDVTAKDPNDEKLASIASKAILNVALTCRVPVVSIASENNTGGLRYSGQLGYDCAAHLKLTAREDGTGPDCTTNFIRHGKKPDKPQKLYFWHGGIISELEYEERTYEQRHK